MLFCRSVAGTRQWLYRNFEFKSGRWASGIARRLRIKLSTRIRIGEKPDRPQVRDWIQRPYYAANFSLAKVPLDYFLWTHGSGRAQCGTGCAQGLGWELLS